MEWKPISEATAVERALLWIDDKNYKGAVMGRIVSSYVDGELSFLADGFHGDWEVTHFCIVNVPKKNEQPRIRKRVRMARV